MTMDRLLLKDLIEKGSDNDLLREMMTSGSSPKAGCSSRTA